MKINFHGNTDWDRLHAAQDASDMSRESQELICLRLSDLTYTGIPGTRWQKKNKVVNGFYFTGLGELGLVVEQWYFCIDVQAEFIKNTFAHSPNETIFLYFFPTRCDCDKDNCKDQKGFVSWTCNTAEENDRLAEIAAGPLEGQMKIVAIQRAEAKRRNDIRATGVHLDARGHRIDDDILQR